MSKIFLKASAVIGCAMLSACTYKIADLELSSKYTFPQGDYAPVGHVHSEVTATSYFTTPVMTREIFQELQRKALEKGGDEVIDFTLRSSNTTFFYVINHATFTMDGTAIKITQIGNQVRTPSTNQKAK